MPNMRRQRHEQTGSTGPSFTDWLRLCVYCALVAPLGCGESQTFIPAPPVDGSATYIFVNEADESLPATWIELKEDEASTSQLPESEGLVAFQYNCSPEDLGLDATSTVRLGQPEHIIASSASYRLSDNTWLRQPPEETAGLGARLDWGQPSICRIRDGDPSYELINLGSTFNGLTGFIKLDDEHVMITSPAGLAVRIDIEGNVEPVPVPGDVRSLYRGAGDSFFLLDAEGHVFRGNLNFEYTPISEGAPIDTFASLYGGYMSNRLTGSPEGEELLISQPDRVQVLKDDGSWETTQGPFEGHDMSRVIWQQPGQYIGLTPDLRLVNVNRDLDGLVNWPEISADFARLQQLGGDFYITYNRILRRLEGQLWRPVAESMAELVPLAATDDWLLLGGYQFIPPAGIRYGVAYTDLNAVCFEDAFPIELDGVPLDAIWLSDEVQYVVNQTFNTAPKLLRRTQKRPINTCGREE